MSTKVKFTDNREHRFVICKPTLDDPTLVVCPKCGGMAKVFPFGEQPDLGYRVRVTCSSCSYVKDKKGTSKSMYWYDEDPTDGYFKYPLWLKTSCCGKSLWAFNKRHLDFLMSFVSAELRERDQDAYGWANSSLASRLPKWIQASKNREQLTSRLRDFWKLGGYSEYRDSHRL
jgi:hypothetical protein